MTAITQALSSALLHFVWQGILVAFLLWFALFLLRRNSAQARYAAACAALAILTLLPLGTAYILYTQHAPPLPVAASAAPLLLTSPSSAATDANPAPRLALLQTWALPVWSLGVLVFSMRLVWGCRQISLLRRRGRPADGGLSTLVAALAKRLRIRRPVSILIASQAESPSVVGWIRPMILMPSATLLGLTTEQLEAVLAHELAHVRRHDYLVNILQVLVETLLFYHPAVWWTSARMRHERELCCDDLAVGCCGDALCYARALTKLERLRIAPPVMAMGSTGGSMLYRVQRLLGGGAQDYAPSKVPGILALVLGVLCFGWNLDRAHGQEKRPGTIAVARTATVADAPGVQVDLAGAALLHRTPVEYPGQAWEQHIVGTVLVEVSLAPDGTVNDARILAGPAELRKSVLRSVLEWHFAPGNGNQTRQININFQHVETAPPMEEIGTSAVNTAGGIVTFKGREHVLGVSPGAPADQRAELDLRTAAVLETLARLEAAHRDAQENGNLAVIDQQLVENQQRLLELKAEDLARQQQSAELTREFLAEEVVKAEQAYKGKLELMEQTQGKAGAEEATQQLKAAEQQLASLQRKLATARGVESFAPDFNGTMTGLTLQRIDIVGLPEASQKELQGRLPVHLGEVLTPSSIEALTKSVNQFDQHLEVNLGVAENGNAELRIVAPGSVRRR